jgi:hypothetical protein
MRPPFNEEEKEKATEREGAMKTEDPYAHLDLEVDVYMPYVESEDLRSASIRSTTFLFETGDLILFPYFHGMVSSDVPFIFRTLALVSKYFSQDAVRALSLIKRLVSDIEKPLSSDRGHELIHLAWGVSMAIQCGARVRILLSAGSYGGFFMDAPGLRIIDQLGRIVMPLTDEAKAVEAGKLASHSGALEIIAGVLSDLAISSGEEGVGTKVQVTADMLNKSSWTVAVEIHRRREDFNKESEAAIRAVLLDLKYVGEPDPLLFGIVGMSNLVGAALVKKRVIPDNATAKVNLKAWALSKDPLLLNLCLFGGAAPTLFWPGGRRVNIGEGDEDPALKPVEIAIAIEKGGQVRKEKRAPVEFLAIRRVPHDVALKDWRTMLDGGFVTVPSKKLTNKEKVGVTIVEGDDLKQAWKVLQRLSRKKETSAFVEGETGVGAVEVDALDDNDIYV